MEKYEKHKYTAGIAFKLLLFFLASMAGIGIVVLFKTVCENIFRG
jgi:hypothetical protein